MDGFELYRQIKKIDDKVKVCFLTAGEMDYEKFTKELFPALDNNCYNQKPIENETLIKRLNKNNKYKIMISTINMETGFIAYHMHKIVNLILC